MCNESRAEQSDWPINSQTMIDLTIEMISHRNDHSLYMQVRRKYFAYIHYRLRLYHKSFILLVQRNAKNDFTHCVRI